MKKFLICISVFFLLNCVVVLAQPPYRPPRPSGRPAPAPPNDFYRMPPSIPRYTERNVYPPRYFNDYRPPVPPIRRYNGPPMYHPPGPSPRFIPRPPTPHPPIPFASPFVPPPPPPYYRPSFQFQIIL